jgi:CheY-like chemotaxis protein
MVSNGLAAVEVARHYRFDLAIAESNLPLMAGPEAINEIRKSTTLCRHIAGIILGSRSSNGDDGGCLHSAESYLTLPFRISVLQATVVESLNNSIPHTKLNWGGGGKI